MIRKIIIITLMIPPFLIMTLISTAEKMTNGLDIHEIKKASKQTLEFSGEKIAQDKETELIFILSNITNYSHIIITLCLIWISIFLYVLIMTWRSKDEKES